MILPSSSCDHIRTLYPENVKQRLHKMSVAVNVIVRSCRPTTQFRTTKKTYPFARYHGVEMKKVRFFPHFKVRAWSQKYPPFSLFLGTSMRAPFHSKFSDRGHSNPYSAEFLKIY